MLNENIFKNKIKHLIRILLNFLLIMKTKI